MKDKYTTKIVLIASVLFGYLANILVGTIKKYGIRNIKLKYILKVLPFSNYQVSIFALIMVPTLILLVYFMKKPKNFKHVGTEYGSAKQGKISEVDQFVEKDTYWIQGVAVSKEIFNSTLKDSNKIKELWKEELYKNYGLKNPKYTNTKESFNKWFDESFKHEINTMGTMNNMLLSKDLKIGYNSARTLNKNVIVVGGSGSGKTRSIIKPNIMNCNTSFVITDPKGTILSEVGTLLYKNGYDIKIFNLLDIKNSMKYNPFAYVRNELDVMTLVNVLIANTTNGKTSDEFWTKAESLLYQALFSYVKEYLTEDLQNFGFIIEMISSMDVEEDDPNYKNPVDIIFDELEQKYTERLLSDPKAKRPFCLTAYQEFKLAAGKTLKSILISCATRLQTFNIPQIQQLVEKDELDIEVRDSDNSLISCYGDHKTALFCITSDSDSSLNFLVAILYTQLFNTLMNTALTDFGGSLPVHLKLLLDEFANIGQIPRFDEIISVVRSRNISVMPVLQTKSQLKKIYKEAADTIIGNCDTEIFLGGKEESTLKEIVASLGKETIDINNESKSYSNNKSETVSGSKIGRELITIDELKTMKLDESIVQIRGLNPFVKVKKYDITQHPNYIYHVDSSDLANPLLFDQVKFIKYQRKIKSAKEDINYIKCEDEYRQLLRTKKIVSIDITEEIQMEEER